MVFFDFDDSRVENLSWLLSSDQLPIVKSQQAMIGGVFHKNGWLFDLELYKKRITGLSTRKSNVAPMDPFPFIQGELEALGVDALLKRQWRKLHLWLSYTYGQSQMKFNDLNQLDFLTYYDQPQVFSIVATLPIEQWSFSIGWNYASGTPNYLNSTFFPEPGGGTPPTSPDPTPAETNSGRFSPQHQLDLSVVYAFPSTIQSWRGSIGLSVLNLYDQENLVEEAFLRFGPTTSQEKRYAIGFAPNLTLNIEW